MTLRVSIATIVIAGWRAAASAQAPDGRGGVPEDLRHVPRESGGGLPRAQP